MPLHEIIFRLICPAVCVHALLRGGAPERIVACSLAAAFCLTLIFQSSHMSYFRAVEWRVWLIDTGLLTVLLAVALCSTRHWPLALTAMDGTTVLAHLAKALDHTIWPYVYIALSNLIAWPIMLLLIPATERHQLRQSRYGIDFAWIWQLPGAYRAGWSVRERRSEAPRRDRKKR